VEGLQAPVDGALRRGWRRVRAAGGKSVMRKNGRKRLCFIQTGLIALFEGAFVKSRTCGLLNCSIPGLNVEIVDLFGAVYLNNYFIFVGERRV
jgi:hypothetical protein